jgi:hypothetical protein
LFGTQPDFFLCLIRLIPPAAVDVCVNGFLEPFIGMWDRLAFGFVEQFVAVLKIDEAQTVGQQLIEL